MRARIQSSIFYKNVRFIEIGNIYIVERQKINTSRLWKHQVLRTIIGLTKKFEMNTESEF